MAKDKKSCAVSFLVFKSTCPTCGKRRVAFLERHSPVLTPVNLRWECAKECDDALPPIERHSGQLFEDLRTLRLLFLVGHVVRVDEAGAISLRNVSFEDAMALRFDQGSPM